MTWTRRHPLVVLFTAASCGICLDRWVSCGMGWWVAALSVWWTWFVLRRRLPDSVKAIVLLVCVTLTLSAWHHVRWRLYPRDHVALPVLSRTEPVPMAVRAIITSLPETTPLRQQQPLSTVPQGVATQFCVRVRATRHGLHWKASSGRLVVRVQGHVLGIGVGDGVTLFGQLVVTPKPRNPGEQDVRLVRRAERILARFEIPYPDCVVRLSRARYHPLAAIGKLRATGLALLDHYVGGEPSRLAGAMLLGAKNRLSPERTESFFHTGTIHLLAISGLHVGMLAWPFLVLARRIGARREWMLRSLMGTLVVYCLLTGGRAPVLRAVILVQILCLGLIWRRNARPHNVLAGAAILVLLLRPADLFRSGAQLSFLAVLALIWLSDQRKPSQLDPLDQLLARARRWHQRIATQFLAAVQQLALAGLVIWVVTMPVVVNRFHLVSPIALALNVVLVIPITCALLAGFGVLLTGVVLSPVAKLCGLVCNASLAFVEGVVRQAHGVPGAFWWVAGSGTAWCLAFYLGIGLLVLLSRRGKLWRRCAVWTLMWVAMPLGYDAMLDAAVGRSTLRCTFLSVGHGTCVVIELPNRGVVLYDAGRMGTPHRAVRLVSGYLWSAGISHVDAIIVSHADADHYNAIPEILRRFSVGHVFVSPVMFDNPSTGVQALRRAMEENRVPWRTLSADDQLSLDESTMRVLHPLEHGLKGSDNANSIVLELTYCGYRILLPGDLEHPGLEQVTAELPRDVDVLMAPHHGSLRSSPAKFSQWCTPEYVVISSGHDHDKTSRQRHAYQCQGRRVLATSEQGAVTIEIGPRGIVASPFLTTDD